MSSDERKCGRARHAFAGFYTIERFSRDFFRFTNAQQTPRSTTCRTTTSVGHHGVLRAPFEKLPIEYTLMMLPASPPRRRAHRLRCRCHAMLHINLTTHGPHAGTRHRHPAIHEIWANYVRRVRKRDLSGLYIASSDHTTHPGTAVRSYGARNHDRLFCGSLKEPAPKSGQKW